MSQLFVLKIYQLAVDTEATDFLVDNNKFKTTAVIAATVIGEPNKYCNICGASLTTFSGKNTSAKVMTIGTPII